MADQEKTVQEETLEQWLQQHRPESYKIWLQAQTVLAIRRGLRDYDDD